MDAGVISVMNDKLPTVAVLMSTYNGEKYIRKQLDSIFSQKGVEVKLFVRDDGSSDGTVGIIGGYSQKYPVTIISDGENVGPGESFMRLLYIYAGEPDIDYFAFSDQDDIWLEKKLIIAVQTIEKCEKDKPILYSSNQFLYENGKNIGKRHKDIQSVTLLAHINKNTIAGCTFVFNKELAWVVANVDKPDRKIIKYRLHDAWIMLVAIVCGYVIYDDECQMLYRIHENNVVGIKEVSFRDKAHRLARMLNRNSSNIRMITAKELLRLYPSIEQESKKILNLFANYKNSIRDKMLLLRNYEIIEECLENAVVFRLKVILGMV